MPGGILVAADMHRNLDLSSQSPVKQWNKQGPNNAMICVYFLWVHPECGFIFFSAAVLELSKPQ